MKNILPTSMLEFYCHENGKNSIVASALTARAWEFPLAQSVERWTPLPEVPGSNLGTGTLDYVFT